MKLSKQAIARISRFLVAQDSNQALSGLEDMIGTIRKLQRDIRSGQYDPNDMGNLMSSVQSVSSMLEG